MALLLALTHFEPPSVNLVVHQNDILSLLFLLVILYRIGLNMHYLLSPTFAGQGDGFFLPLLSFHKFQVLFQQ